MRCSEKAKAMVQPIQTFIKEECTPMADTLLQLDDLPTALRQRSTALDGAPLYVPGVDLDDQRSDQNKLVNTEPV